jgi:hypothetical protein
MVPNRVIEYNDWLEGQRSGIDGSMVEHSLEMAYRVWILKRTSPLPDLSAFSILQLRMATYVFCIGKSLTQHRRLSLGGLDFFKSMEREELIRYIHQKNWKMLRKYSDAYIGWLEVEEVKHGKR